MARRKQKMLDNFKDNTNITPYEVDITNDIQLNLTLNLIKKMNTDYAKRVSNAKKISSKYESKLK